MLRLTTEQQAIIDSISAHHKVEITIVDEPAYTGIIENEQIFIIFILDLVKSKRIIRVYDQTTTLEKLDFSDKLSDIHDPNNLERCIRLAIKLLEQI